MRGTVLGLLFVFGAVLAIVLTPIPVPEKIFEVTPALGKVGDRGATDGGTLWTPLSASIAGERALRSGEYQITLRTSDAAGNARFLDLETTLDVRDVTSRSGDVLLVGGRDELRGAVVERFVIVEDGDGVRVTRSEFFRDDERGAVVALALDSSGTDLALVTDDGTVRVIRNDDVLGPPHLTWTMADEPRLADVTSARAVTRPGVEGSWIALATPNATLVFDARSSSPPREIGASLLVDVGP